VFFIEQVGFKSPFEKLKLARPALGIEADTAPKGIVL
jgi:hypothetical protein